MTISERIFELLKERGYTQKEFSKKTGIAESTISDWKKKGTNPVSDKILTICDVLEVSPYYLLSGTEREDRKTIKTASAKTVTASASEKKERSKKQEVKKSEADEGIRLPETVTIARDEADYRIGKADEEKPGKKEKKKDKKDKRKDTDTGGKDKKKKKDKKKDKKKKGYLIVS